MATELSLLKSGHASNSTAATGGRTDDAKTQTRTSNKAERAGSLTLSKPWSHLPDPYQQSLTWSQVAKRTVHGLRSHSLRELRNELYKSTVQAFLRIFPLWAAPPHAFYTHRGPKSGVGSAVAGGCSAGPAICLGYQWWHFSPIVCLQLRSGRRGEKRFKPCIWWLVVNRIAGHSGQAEPAPGSSLSWGCCAKNAECHHWTFAQGWE